MKTGKLKDMTRGWFLGDFEPSMQKIKDCEVGIRHYVAGDYEKKHLHKIATETTVIVSGIVKMNGEVYAAGDIIVMEPGEATDFLAVTDAINVVVKTPCVIGDKYLVEDISQG